jgi:mono/diheme cytochrome c family protein
MRRRAVRVAITLAVSMVVIAMAAVVLTLLRYPRVWDLPLPAVRIPPDPALVERGRYIVYGPGRCADCHTPDAARPLLARGDDAPLTGGPGETTYLGTWTAPNLTPDVETGLGGIDNGHIARMLRHGIDRRGHIALPFMDAYKDLADADLAAIVAYLRSVPPARGTPPAAEVNLLGKVALTWFIEPYAPDGTPPAAMPPEPTVIYGRYVAGTLAGCGACHTARNLRTGTYLSPLFSGGLAFRSRLDPARMYVSPNLTPDPATGHLNGWSEEDFIQRFRSGLRIPDSPMPWGGFQRMTDTDLRALFRYLQSLPPIAHDVGPIVQPAHGAMAG